MNTNVVKVRLARELPLVHLVVNDVIRLSTVGQRMTEQKNSSKTTALAQALLLEQVEFFKTIIYRKLTYLFPAVHSVIYATC